MRTVIIIVVGLLLLFLCNLVARILGGSGTHALVMASKVFIPIWFCVALVNLWAGVTRAGYTIAEELPIFLVIFAIPAGAAALVWWKFVWNGTGTRMRKTLPLSLVLLIDLLACGDDTRIAISTALTPPVSPAMLTVTVTDGAGASRGAATTFVLIPTTLRHRRRKPVYMQPAPTSSWRFASRMAVCC